MFAGEEEITRQLLGNCTSAGLNGAGFAIAIAPNGNVYVGGTFTTAGGKTVGYCAYYDGANWQTMGNELGLNAGVLSIAISKDGSQVYLGGTFTGIGAEIGKREGNLIIVAPFNCSIVDFR